MNCVNHIFFNIFYYITIYALVVLIMHDAETHPVVCIKMVVKCAVNIVRIFQTLMAFFLIDFLAVLFISCQQLFIFYIAPSRH